VVFGLAALAKLTMGPMLLVVMLAVWIAERWNGQPSTLSRVVWVLVGMAAPVVAWYAVQASQLGPESLLEHVREFAGYREQLVSPSARVLTNLGRIGGAAPPWLLAWGAPLALIGPAAVLSGVRVRAAQVWPSAFLTVSAGFFVLSAGWSRYGFWMTAALALAVGLWAPAAVHRLAAGRQRLVFAVTTVALLCPAAWWALERIGPRPDVLAEVAALLNEQAAGEDIGTTEWELDFVMGRTLTHPPTFVATLTQEQVDAAFDWRWPDQEWVVVGVVGSGMGADVKLEQSADFIARLNIAGYQVFQRYRGPTPGWKWPTVGATATPPLDEAAIGQSFVAAQDVLTEVRVLLAGGGRATNAPVRLRLYAYPPTGEPLAEVELPGATVVENRWYRFPMKAPVRKGERYYLELSSPAAVGQTAAVAWYQENADNYPDGEWAVDRQPRSGDLYFGVLGYGRR
jgi:hypothetical protein